MRANFNFHIFNVRYQNNSVKYNNQLRKWQNFSYHLTTIIKQIEYVTLSTECQLNWMTNLYLSLWRMLRRKISCIAKKSNCYLTGVVDKHIRGVLYEQKKKLKRKDLYFFYLRHNTIVLITPTLHKAKVVIILKHS